MQGEVPLGGPCAWGWGPLPLGAAKAGLRPRQANDVDHLPCGPAVAKAKLHRVKSSTSRNGCGAGTGGLTHPPLDGGGTAKEEEMAAAATRGPGLPLRGGSMCVTAHMNVWFHQKCPTLPSSVCPCSGGGSCSTGRGWGAHAGGLSMLWRWLTAATVAWDRGEPWSVQRAAWPCYWLCPCSAGLVLHALLWLELSAALKGR